MRKSNVWIGFIVIILVAGVCKVQAESGLSESYGEPLATYVGQNGIEIISYSKNWVTQDKLKSIYDELMNNAHGEEIKYFSEIYIYPDLPVNYPKGFTSFCHEKYIKTDDGKFVFQTGCYIDIFNGNQYSDIAQLARIISHEYGHHFTFYYLMTKKNLSKEQWINSEYAKIRQLNKYPRITYLGDASKSYSHEWDIAEILAEDYVQIYGSSLVKKTRDYLDTNERLQNSNFDAHYYYSDFNLLPQENLELKLAADVDGLVDYFYNLSGVKLKNMPEKLKISAPYLSSIHNVFKNYNSYVWQWNKVNDLETKNQYEYTLIINPIENNDYPIPLKTVYSGEPLTATSGSGVDLKKGIGILNNYEGDYQVRLFVKDSYGFMHSSSIREVTITPKDNSKTVFSDIADNYWAIDYIYDLTNRDIVKGYVDGTFRPNGKITRAEFMTFLVRTIDSMQLKTDTSADHWFIHMGYEDIALNIGLLNNSNNNEIYFNGAISRKEMAQMVYKMLDYSGKNINVNYQTTLTDVKQNDSFTEISIVNYYGIINGYPDETFRPESPTTRAEAMKMVSKYIDVTAN